MIIATSKKEMWDVGIRDILKDEILILDGAMGTMLQNSGLKLGELPEVLNIENPETIIGIHKKYVEAEPRS